MALAPFFDRVYGAVGGHLSVSRETLTASLEGITVGIQCGVELSSNDAWIADEWVTQMLRQSDAQVFKKYSQMKLQMKREALEKMNRQASEMAAQGTPALCTAMLQ